MNSKKASMDIQTLKLELVKSILNIESKTLLDKLYTSLKGEEIDFYDELTDEQKEEIEISRKQVAQGETEDWESIYNRLK